jgi:peptidoglycan/xylan/chitin deacetylase (PgdA/CDA1 family)
MRATPPWTRRQFLATAVAGSGIAKAASDRKAAESDRALIAVTLDLEMSRNFPDWNDTHWDYEKGNLNTETKRYAVEAGRRVKAAGGVIHYFAVGRVFEQESVDWLKGIVSAGHLVGNHTYDHVNVRATRLEDLQFRFKRAPWLIEGKGTAEVIRENIRLTTSAFRARLGTSPVGFRTPAGFAEGLRDRPDVRAALRAQGFDWVSSLYPSHKMFRPGEAPGADVFDSIVAAQKAAQPFVYPDGLVELPMSPVSDIGAFRNGRWRLDDFLESLSLGIGRAIDERAVFDFLGHPSCLYVTDPEFRAIDLICDLIRKAGPRATFADLGTLAEGGRASSIPVVSPSHRL